MIAVVGRVVGGQHETQQRNMNLSSLRKSKFPKTNASFLADTQLLWTMWWILLTAIPSFYAFLAFIALLFIPAKVAKPPWHLPNPGKTLSSRNLPPSWQGLSSPSDLGLIFEDVHFTSYASLTLRGWLIYASSVSEPSRKAVVCVHGAGRDRRAFLRHSSFLAEAGYDVLLFDCSNHGTSDSLPMWPLAAWPGRAVSLGKREHLDVSSAVLYLRQRGAQHITVLATSQGATSSIIAAAQSHFIDLLILENPFASPDALIAGVVNTVLRKIPVPFFRRIMAEPIIRLSLLRTGNFPAETQLRALDFVSRVKVPMFFIHGNQDVLVHHSQSQLLHDTATCTDKHIWIVDGAAHTQCYNKQPELFREKVLLFLRSHCTE